MLSKEQHIDFWKQQADDDWAAVDALFAIERYSQALFWAHLVLEKYSKAIWVRDNTTNIPPKTHNLNHLLSQTTIVLTDEALEFLLEVNRFQIEGRYPEYITFMNELCNHDFTLEKIKQINLFRICLLDNLQ